MARPKGDGYTPDLFDQQFVKVLFDLQTRGISLARNERRLETLIGVTKGAIWKVKKSETGISKNKRDNVVKAMQNIFGVNPLFFGKQEAEMYNNGSPKIEYEDISESPVKNILTAGDHLELQRLRIINETLRDQIKSKDQQIKALQEQISTLQKLIDLYENSAKFSAK
ncbi:hypothetical protein SAMN05660461_5968 [Chitinophaga ginsengisegetis]|uniref:Uncharacterized protein n=1 Tax=Chitinophaga ginsengisegetis TaxID=393003 RepID=A0A1T5PCF6_9BACT|nr:hypothetical protein [Chitinophaga ginsengisegetis]SKD10068.1 hypothetical protein SAMN05660461_5968 [Chitinophaga ginsengisegetis]